MCRSAAEGGQRCASHAQARYEAAKEAYRVAHLDYTQGREMRAAVHLDAFAAARQARVEYASTPQGEAELTALAERTGDAQIVEDVAKGLELRARNAEVRYQARRSAARAALKDVARSRVNGTGSNATWMAAAETQVLHARLDAFTTAASLDRRLRAPRTFAATAHEVAQAAGLEALGREVTYGLWRAQHTGADIAPPAPEGTTYTTMVTSWEDLRPGDVIDTASALAPADVTHEGKVVASTATEDGAATVTFADGTADRRTRSTFTVLRPHTPQQQAAYDAYERAVMYAVDTGVDERGFWAADPDTGQKHYLP